MKVKCKIKTSKEEYFDFIIDNVVLEIKKYGHKKVKKENLKKGYTYQKSLFVKNKKYAAKVIISKLDRPFEYSSITMVSNGKSYRITYVLNDDIVYYYEDVVDKEGNVLTSVPEIGFGFLKKLSVKKRLRRIGQIINYRKTHEILKP